MASEEPTSAETGKNFLHKNPAHETVAAPSVGDQTLVEERKDFDEKGQKIMGFASSVVRTLEEKAIIEKKLPNNHMDNGEDVKDQTIIQESESSPVQSGNTGSVDGGPHEPNTVDGVLLGAPANHKSPPLKSDMDSDEHAAASARAIIRADIRSRSSRKHWTVPTVKPKVGPQDFEDPISDAFWKNIWIASAVHNVGAFLLLASIMSSMLC